MVAPLFEAGGATSAGAQSVARYVSAPIEAAIKPKTQEHASTFVQYWMTSVPTGSPACEGLTEELNRRGILA
jgi:hypothetical protein